MEILKFEVWGFNHAIRGMRNPMNSHDKSDSTFDEDGNFVFGRNDLDLAKRLCKAGSDHRKFMRQIFVSADITAPIYWWKEYDTYKIGTVANSTSIMHKLSTTPITINCFEHDEDIEMEDYMLTTHMMFNSSINHCEKLRQKFLKTNDKKYWRALIQLLPESWLQTRTVTMSYENLRNMYFARKNHKLSEWHTFCNWIKSLPYEELIAIEEEG